MNKTVYPFAEQGNYTQQHNLTYDYMMRHLSGSAWKILCLVIRHTRGYHQVEVKLSYPDIREGTGISSSATIQHALNELLDLNEKDKDKRNPYITRTPGTIGGRWKAAMYGLNRNFKVEKAVTETVTGSAKAVTVSVTGPTTETVTASDSHPFIHEKTKKTNNMSSNGSTAPLKKVPVHLRPVVLEVFHYWQEKCDHKKAMLDERRALAISRHLEAGRTLSDLKLVIDGACLDPFTQGDNDRQTKYDSISLLFRDAEHVEKFIAIAEASRKQEPKSSTPKDDFYSDLREDLRRSRKEQQHL